MYYTDDPIRDFERWDRERERRLEFLPVCVDCGHHIQADYFYEINGEPICPACMESGYRKEMEDYIE